MPPHSLTGSRIRERRMIAGLRQAELAKRCGISASYLNLIEHNRRGIGGKLLLRIADTLAVDAATLTDGVSPTLVAALRQAEANARTPGVELAQIDEFAGRFPGWAALLATQQARIERLEQLTGSLSDRLAHDPALAASVHEVLSTAASIRSTAAILAETDELQPQWTSRFHANINEDSARLAQSSRALAQYLETDGAEDHRNRLPQEEVDAFLEQSSYFFQELEDNPNAVEQALRGASLSVHARALARGVLQQYATDAAMLPATVLRQAIDPGGAPDPVALATLLGKPAGLVMRRLACLPEIGAGYVLCDRSGGLLLRKGLAGFSLPRFGASCPLWPVFQALAQPGTVLRQRVTQLGHRQSEFDCIALAEPIGPQRYNQPPLLRAGMLILHAPPETPETALPVGTSCRVCPNPDCAGRREPSILDHQAF